MTPSEAEAEIRRILGDAASQLSDEDMAAAIKAATTDGTIDVWLAAAEAAEILGIRALGSSGVLKWTSEGTTVERRAADFFGMRDALKDKSSNTTGRGVSVISVDDPGSPDRCAVGTGDGYWTWDSDVPEWFPWRT